MGSQPVQGAPSAFRKHLPDLSLPRFTTMKKQTPYEYAKEFIEGGQPPWLHGLFMHWRELLKEPFKGVTNDGESLQILVLGFPLTHSQEQSAPASTISTMMASPLPPSSRPPSPSSRSSPPPSAKRRATTSTRPSGAPGPTPSSSSATRACASRKSLPSSEPPSSKS